MDPLVEIGTDWTGVGIFTLALNFSSRRRQGRESQHKVVTERTLRCNVALKCHPLIRQVMVGILKERAEGRMAEAAARAHRSKAIQ